MATKKIFVATAKEIAEMKDRTEAKSLADNFVNIFKKQNPLFNTGRFLTACKLN